MLEILLIIAGGGLIFYIALKPVIDWLIRLDEKIDTSSKQLDDSIKRLRIAIKDLDSKIDKKYDRLESEFLEYRKQVSEVIFDFREEYREDLERFEKQVIKELDKLDKVLDE